MLHMTAAAVSAPPVLGRAETPIAFIQCIVDAYARRGLDPTQALLSAHISPSTLQQADAKVSSLQMERMSAAAMRELNDEALGWFDRALHWGSYAMLLRASLSAPNLRVALQRWCRHHGLLTQQVTVHLLTQGHLARLQLQEHQPLHQAPYNWQAFCVVSVLRNALGVAQWLIDSRIQLQSIDLAFAPPPQAESYPLLFEGPITFSATQHQVEFDARYLDLPIKRDEAALQRLLQRPLELMVRPYRRDRLLRERVRQLLHNAPGLHTAEAVATQIHLSVRSLHRQLRDEGTSLQALKDNVRQQRATDLLLRSHKNIKQIAAEVGFANEKSFLRAFKTWTGMTPADWRQRLSDR
jgi:AraC-like DNA-binding protein